MVPTKVQFDIKTLFAMIGEREAIVQALQGQLDQAEASFEDYKKVLEEYRLHSAIQSDRLLREQQIIQRYREHLGRKCDCFLFENLICNICQWPLGKDTDG